MATTETGTRPPTGTAAAAALLQSLVRGRTWNQVVWLVLLVFVLYLFVPNPSLAIQILIFGLWAVSTNLLLGYGGLVSFGHALYFYYGSYAAGLVLTRNLTQSLWVSLLAAMALSGLIAVGAGAVCLRRRSVYFSMLTLAFAQLGYFIAFEARWLTGGDDGLRNIPTPPITLPGVTIALNPLRDPAPFFWFTAAIVGLCFVLLLLFTESPLGRVLQAIRESEERARGCGYNTNVVQLLTFAVSGVFAGLAGGLNAVFNGVIGLDPYWRRSEHAVRVDDRGHRLPPPAALPEHGVRGVAADPGRDLRRQRPRVPPGAVGPGPAGAGERPGAARRSRPKRRGVTADGAVLSARGLDRWFGGIHAVQKVDLEIGEGRLHAIIGPNGSGKSTLFNLITGHTRAGSGEVWFGGRRVTGLPYHRIVHRGIAKSYQITTVFQQLTVLENVRIAAQSATAPYVFWFPAPRLRDVTRRAEETLARVGLRRRQDDLAGTLSHGELRNLDIAIALATGPRLLLLDEPTAGMSPAETAATTALIQELQRDLTIVMIEHKMDVVLSISDRVTVLNLGEKLFEGTPDEVRGNARVREVYLQGSL
jgi:branched-chain amino acid transport system ATP-binding protein